MSTRSTRESRCRVPSSLLMSITTLRLLRFSYMKRKLLSTPCLSLKKGGCSLDGSPSGGSTFMTSAPMSPRAREHICPNPVVRSSTRIC